MADSLPQFDEPPVIETVLGVQFDRLPDFTAAHAGWFWREALPSSWTKANEAPRLTDQFERFGEEDRFGVPGIAFRPHESERIQLISNDDERMIQIQDSRFILNWRKRTGPYPSYERLLPEFRDWLEKYRSFANKVQLGDVSINQWEITYLNHVPKGSLWRTPNDFSTLLPGLYASPPSEGFTWDHIDGDWRFCLRENLGRLHVSAKHGQLIQEPRTEVLILNFTARGPVRQEGQSWQDGFELGHEAIVRFFDAITSVDAHKVWKKKRG